MSSIVKIENIEIPMTKELQDFFAYKYHNQTSKLVDEFLIFLRTQKEAHEINRALSEVNAGKTNPVGTLLDAL